MSRIKSIAENLRFILSRQITDALQELDSRQSERADGYEQALDERIEERLSDFDRRLEERMHSIDLRIDEKFDAIDKRLDDYSGHIDARMNEKFEAIERRNDERNDKYEAALDGRINERLAALENQIDQRAVERAQSLDDRIEERMRAVDERFEERARAIDGRLDDRLSKIEQHIDSRFGIIEKRADDRMQRHERKIDSMVRQMSNDIVERNDIMLQIFEQRLDHQRQELRALRPHQNKAAASRKNSSKEPVASDGQVETDESPADEADQQRLLKSFRKLADVTDHARMRVKSSKMAGKEVALYHRILDWKQVAHEGLDQFTPDEQETADYILSFLDDPREIDYVRAHMRRFISTLQRIPPALRSTDRLLELGSLSHLTPAISKYCGYREISCADFWQAEEKQTSQPLKQKKGKDSFTFELSNFNVERDPFPYPDGHFRVVLCCELIEHLQSDPMHMLWECNRVLENGGFLLLTTPNIASARAIEGLLVGCAPYLLAQYNVRETVDQHNREYAPYEIGVALAAAGFKVAELETEDVWARSNPAILDLLRQVEISTELRGDNIFALGRKTGPPIERYPKELYID